MLIFGNKLTTGVKIGAVLVGAGAAWYAYESRGRTQRRFGPATNGGILSKPWGESKLAKPWVTEDTGVSFINLPARPSSAMSGGGESGAGTPLGDLVDRKELEDLHSSVGVKEDRKPRRRSIGEGLVQI